MNHHSDRTTSAPNHISEPADGADQDDYILYLGDAPDTAHLTDVFAKSDDCYVLEVSSDYHIGQLKRFKGYVVAIDLTPPVYVDEPVMKPKKNEPHYRQIEYRGKKKRWMK